MWYSVHIITHALNNLCRPYVRQLINSKLFHPLSLHSFKIYCKVMDNTSQAIIRSIHPKVFSRKGVLKICSKFTDLWICKFMLCNFTEITLRHGCSPVNLLYIFRTSFPKNLSGRLLLDNRNNRYGWLLSTCYFNIYTVSEIIRQGDNKFEQKHFLSKKEITICLQSWMPE